MLARLLRWPLCLLVLSLVRSGEAIALSHQRAAPSVPVPVFVHVARPKDDYVAIWIFKPIIDTLKDAFESYGTSIKVLYSEDSCGLVEQVAASTQNLVTPIAISLISHSVVDSSTAACKYDDTWAKLRPLGAYVIVYSSESHPSSMARTAKKAFLWQAHEVWHYSKYIAGVLATTPVASNSISRFMPPGCAKGLDLNVDVAATMQNENQVGFVGKWGDRTSVTQEAYASLSAILDVGGQRYDAPSLHDYFESYPVQINIHSKLNNGPIAALESFRFALLLSNSACVISEPGAAMDMDVWRPVVNFANQTDIKSSIETNWMGKHEAIQQCRQRSKKDFCTMFSPAKLFSESGFPTMLASLQSGERTAM